MGIYAIVLLVPGLFEATIQIHIYIYAYDYKSVYFSYISDYITYI